MKENEIEVREYDAVSSDVIHLASNQLTSSLAKKNEVEDGHNLIWVDPRCCFALYSKLNSDQVLLQPSPLALPKALKVVHTACLFIFISFRTSTTQISDSSYIYLITLKLLILLILSQVLHLRVDWLLSQSKGDP